MNIRNRNTTEYLSNDILEDDFVNMFRSIYRLQFMFGTSRVDVRNRFVTPPTPVQKCYTTLCVIVTFVSIYLVVTVYFGMMTDMSVTTLGISIVSSIFTASTCNCIHVRFFNGRQNSEFLVRMQKLDRLMRIDKCKAINSSLKRINDVSVCLIVVVFLSLIGMACTSEDFKELCFLGVALGVMAFTLELIACSSIVVYFCIRVRFVNSLIESYLKQDENVRKPIIIDSAPIKYIRFLADTDNDFTTSQAHIYLKEIFSCFTMFQGLYRFQLLLFSIKLVVISLMSFEMVLYTMSKNIYSLSQVASPVVFVIMDSFIAAFLAYRFQVFFYEVKRTKSLCIGVMAFQQDGPLRDKARTMLKMVEETPPTFSVYDMWEMNAGMFLTICSLVTGLIVTLIQFQFL